jgi:hypothetical protein
MAEPIDPGTLKKWKYVLRHWKSDSYVLFNARSQKWIRDNLGGGKSPQWFAERLWKEVNAGRATPKRIREMGDAAYYANDFHDDLIVTCNGRRIYVETVFDEDEDEDGCRIYIVNVKDSHK